MTEADHPRDYAAGLRMATRGPERIYMPPQRRWVPWAIAGGLAAVTWPPLLWLIVHAARWL